MGKVIKIYRVGWFVLALIFLGVFLSVQNINAAVVINEIMYDPIAADEGKEWVELYNNGDSAVDLAGYLLEWGGSNFSFGNFILSGIIPAKKYFLIGGSQVEAEFGVVPDLNSTLIPDFLEKLNLQNGGDETDGVRLCNSEEYCDTVLYGEPNSNGLAGDEATPGKELCSDVVFGHSLSRKSTGVDNNLASDWEDLNAPTPHNSSYEERITVDTGDTTYSNKVIINELLPNPSGSDDNEWVELYNNGTTTVDVAGWKIADAGGHSFTITDSAAIPVGGFFTAENMTGVSLNNSGDTIKLLQPDDTADSPLQQVSYGSGAQDDYCFALDADGNYQWTTTCTKNNTNIINAPVQETSSTGGGPSSSSNNQAESSKDTGSVFKDKIFITELLPNPFGLDGEANEWLEIYNTSTGMVILDGWKIKDNGGTYILREKKIEPKSFLVFKRGETQLILNNEGGDWVELWDNDGKLVNKAAYKSQAPEGTSYNWCGKSWVWLKETTEGAENKCPLENDLPVAYFEVENNKVVVGQIIIVNGEESYDPDGKIVKYVWQFSDEVVAGQERNKIFETISPLIGSRFLKAGIHQITLRVVDNLGGEDSYTEEIEVRPDSQPPANYENIFINEIMPNPLGKDEGQEWLELYNGGELEAELGGFSLAIDKGKTYKIPAGTKLPKGGYGVFTDAITKLVLYNDGGVVRLADATGKLLREINYGQSHEGQSYARDEEKGNSWSWTIKPTAVAANIILGQAQAVKTITGGTSQAVGSFVRISGRVTAEPGLLGKTIFYLQEDSGRGAQIYSYYKDFPNLAIGDLVEVSGTISDYQGERRIKIKTRNDIKVIANGEATLPVALQIEDAGEDNEGALIKITGQLTDIKGSYLWLDDGTEEIKVYIKQNTNINKDGLVIGDNLEVTGIVSQYGEEYRILPRYPEDLKVVGKVLGVETDDIPKGAIADSGNILKYFLAAAVAAILVLATLVIRARGKSRE